MATHPLFGLVLGTVLAASALVVSPGIAHAEAPARVVATSSDPRGVTFTMELAGAPNAAAPTVLVFVPRHHRPAANGQVGFIVHFHGHNTTAERAIAAHRLREQLDDSKQNAILVVPQLAVMAADSSAGRHETPGTFSKMLTDVLAGLDRAEVRRELGASATPAAATVGRVVVSAHSGGYHAAACAIKHGGVAIQEVYLFDALYADTDVFRDWVVRGRGKPMGSRHKLVSYFTAGSTETNTQRLFADLEKAGVAVVRENVEGSLSRADLTHAEAVSIRTSTTHGTVTNELNSLRDCLYASALRRRLRTSWFDAKHGARPLERRR
ncbi:MAG: hypothetical protein KIT84_26080 [Labilithrix sp.]|nr:hypothetical protein [Labilithrix sp.]MCW5814524.1 hypothetical protein [Labilithrix sp.]